MTRGELYTCCIVVIGVILDQYCPLDITVEAYKSEFAFPLFQDQQEAIDQVTNPRRPLSSTFCQDPRMKGMTIDEFERRFVWIADSGASTHMTNEWSGYKNVRKIRN